MKSQREQEGNIPFESSHYRHAISVVLQRLQRMTFAPAWLPEPWRHPFIGYVLAASMQLGAVSLVAFLIHIFPSFAFAGLLAILVVALVALTWGAGPSLLATLLGALMLDLFALPPYFSWSLESTTINIGLVLFLATGITISLVASQIEQARTEREQAFREAKQNMDVFVSIASHELKTPLSAISMTVQMARRRLTRVREDADELERARMDVLDMLERAEHQIALQNRLVNDLLDVSRMQTNQLELLQEDCDLVAIVRNVVEDIRHVHMERLLRLELLAEEIPVHVDSERIGQVLSNYLTNALKYSQADRPIDISVRIEGMNAWVGVRDDGPGLSPAEQEHIWQRFYRVKGIGVQSGTGVGLGLGLHISSAVIKQHGGQVGVESCKGKGATFWFMLPLTSEKH